jgi:4-amino-4-deoxy-L-arabinose transferase-like glycosyltransferase
MATLAVAQPSTAGRADGSFVARLSALVEASHARACAVLLVLSLACFLPGIVSLQPMDRDEPRFAQASKQMLETGDFVDIRFQGEARHKKPVGIYWLQSGVVAAAEALGFPQARTTIAVYRIPSLIGAVAMVLLTYWAALAFAARREAFLAAAFMAASIILMVEARLAKTDAVLGACSVAAMGGLARAYLARGVGRLPLFIVLTFWTAVGFGILVKGPMVVMFAGLCALALSIRERSARWLLKLRPALGAAVLVLLVAPWFLAIALKSGGAFYAEAVGHDMLGKVGAAQKVHWAPPGFYLLAFFATFWPAAILAVIAVPFAWAHRRENAVAFLLAWIVPSWLVLEAVPTKLPHYVMPLYPAIAVIAATALARGFVGPQRAGAKAAALLIPFIPAGIAIALAVAASSLDDTLPWAGFGVLMISAAISLAAWRCFSQHEPRRAALLAVAASVPLSIGVFAFTQPVLRSLKLSPRLAEAAYGLGCAEPAIGTLGYREPSLVFLVGTELRMLDNAQEAASFVQEGGCRMAFVERRFEDEFRARLDGLGVRPTLVTRVFGFNLNSGRRLEIAAYAAKP